MIPTKSLSLVVLVSACVTGVTETRLTFDRNEPFGDEVRIDEICGDRVAAVSTPGFGYSYGGNAATPNISVSYSLGTCFRSSSVPNAYGELKNVIYSFLILADDLRYGDLSCLGQKFYHTPAIDRLAAEGVKATPIFTSDNGPHYGGSTGGLKGKKSTPWEGGSCVPFIVRYPALLPRSRAIDVPIWSLELFPTLLELCGVEPPKDRVIDGENIVSVLRGRSREHSPIFTCHNEKIITIRDGDWKLYLTKPRYLSARDLNPDYIDSKAPNGKTCLEHIAFHYKKQQA